MHEAHEGGPSTMSCEDRYEAFLQEVIENRAIWILINADQQFLKIYAEDEDFEYLPVWSNAGAAEAYAQGQNGLVAHAVSLPEFLQRWVAGLSGDQLEVGVWPEDDGSVWVLSPSELREELSDALSDL